MMSPTLTVAEIEIAFDATIDAPELVPLPKLSPNAKFRPYMNLWYGRRRRDQPCNSVIGLLASIASDV
jgi:hypothetical protein